MDSERQSPYEYEPVEVMNFAEAALSMPESISLVLSRNRVAAVQEGENWGYASVQYEGLNDIGLGWHEENGNDGRLVTKQFTNGALEVVVSDLKHERSATVYPRLTIVNADTQQSLQSVVDVAGMVVSSEAQIREVEASDGDEARINVSIQELAGRLSKLVGVPADQAIVVGLHTPQPLRNMIPLISMGVDSLTSGIDDEILPVEYDKYGPTAIRLLQMQASEDFRSSPYRTTPLYGDGVEVELCVRRLPDMQACMLDLIDTIEARGNTLRCLRRQLYNDGTMGYELSIFDDRQEEVMSLYGNESLNVTIYGAYLKAMELFPH